MTESSNSESLPPQEIIGRQGQWRSVHSLVAKETLGKVMRRDRTKRFSPETTEDVIKREILLKQEKLMRYLDVIDQEVVGN